MKRILDIYHTRHTMLKLDRIIDYRIVKNTLMLNCSLSCFLISFDVRRLQVQEDCTEMSARNNLSSLERNYEIIQLLARQTLF